MTAPLGCHRPLPICSNSKTEERTSPSSIIKEFGVFPVNLSFEVAVEAGARACRISPEHKAPIIPNPLHEVLENGSGVSEDPDVEVQEKLAGQVSKQLPLGTVLN
jgi:hypothetical protein